MASFVGRFTSKWDAPKAENKSSLEAAAEAAAKVNAMLVAKGKLKPSQLSMPQVPQKTNVKGNHMAEVEINDVLIGTRNYLTRWGTHEEISKLSGAAVSTRGRYMTEDDKLKNATAERPLYLCVQGPTPESVQIACNRIHEIIANGYKRKALFSKLNKNSGSSNPFAAPPVPGVLPAAPGPPQSLMSLNPQPTPALLHEDRVYIGLEHAPPSFDAKGKLLGPGGAYLGHIMNESNALITLRGRGSGHIEPTTGMEAMEAMHIHIQHPNPLGLQRAKELATDLVQTVQNDYAQFQQLLVVVSMPPPVITDTAALLAGLQHQQHQISQQQAGLLQGPHPGTTSLSSIPSLMTSPMLSAPSGSSSVQGLFPQSSGALNSIPNFQTSLTTVASPQMLQQPIQTSLTYSSQPGPMAFASPSAGQIAMTSQPLTSQHMTLTSQPALSQLGGQPGQPLLAHQIGLLPQQDPGGQPLLQHQIQQQIQQQQQIIHPPPQQPTPLQLQQLQQQQLGSQGIVPSRPVPYSTAIVTSTHSTVPATSIMNQAPSTYLPGVPSYYNYVPAKEEPQKRKFTEEKQEDKLPENLLGYQHGPPHISLTQQHPNPQAPQFHGPPGQHPYQSPPPPLQWPPGQLHQHQAQQGYGPPPPPPEDHRQAQAVGGETILMTPPPPPPLLMGEDRRELDARDSRLMPPPHQLPTSQGEPAIKRGRPGFDEDCTEQDSTGIHSTMRQQQREAAKYSFNQYSSKPHVYNPDNPTREHFEHEQRAYYHQPDTIVDTFQSNQYPTSVQYNGQQHFESRSQHQYEEHDRSQFRQHGQPVWMSPN